jgi:hypothetical protein
VQLEAEPNQTHIVSQPEQSLCPQAETNGIVNYNPMDYEERLMALNLSVDDIGVTRQNPTRPMEEDATKSKYVRHTVVHF